MAVAHGGNVYEIASRLGCSPDLLLDYSAIINPLGPPPGLLEAFHAAFHRLQHYPDISNRSLLEALARFHEGRALVTTPAGQGVGLIREVRGCRQIVQEYRESYAAAIEDFGALVG